MTAFHPIPDGSGLRGMSRIWERLAIKVAAAFLAGLGGGVTLGLLFGKVNRGLLDGLLLGVAGMISASGLGPMSRDR